MSTAIQRFYEFVANSTLAPQVTEYLPDNKDNRIWTKNLRQGVLITTCAIFLVSSVPSLLFRQGTRRITEHKSIADLNYPKPHCDGKFQCQAVSGTNGNLEWQTHCPERILKSGHIKLRRGRSIDLLDEPSLVNWPIPPIVPFSVTMAGPIGDYSFSIHAVGSDPSTVTHDAAVLFRVVDFGVSALSPASISVPHGGTSTSITFQVIAQGSFNGVVSLCCPSGLPSGARCNRSPSASVSDFPASVQFTIRRRAHRLDSHR